MGRPKPPLLPISTDFYLSVLAGKAVLPSLLQVINPPGEGGAVPGMGVPLDPNVGKESLAKPLQRGIYALSTPDRKTVLKLRVLSKEEAGFDPEGVTRALAALTLDPEILNRMRATWMLLQLTFEAHDPGLYPGLDFMTGTASRLALLTEGVVADPLAGQYWLPQNYPTPRDSTDAFVVTDHVRVTETLQGGNFRIATAGLAKFAHPELAVTQVPETWRSVAASFVLSVAAGVLRGKVVEAGDRLVASDGWIAGGSPEHGAYSPIIELLPMKGSVDEALAKWAKSL